MTTKVRPVLPLPGKPKGSSENNYVSQCKNCSLGIFRTQSYRWQSGRLVGLVHDFDCEGGGR